MGNGLLRTVWCILRAMSRLPETCMGAVVAAGGHSELLKRSSSACDMAGQKRSG